MVRVLSRATVEVEDFSSDRGPRRKNHQLRPSDSSI
jgi:hypothetical protein